MNIFYVLIYLSESHNFQNCSSPSINARLNDDYVIACPSQKNYNFELSYIHYNFSVYILEYSDYEHIFTFKKSNKDKMPTLYIFDQAKVKFHDIKYYNGQINIIGSPSLSSEYNLTFKKVNMYNTTLEFPFLYDEISYSDGDLYGTILLNYNCSGNLSIHLLDYFTYIKCLTNDHTLYVSYPNLIRYLNFTVSQFSNYSNVYINFFNKSYINKNLFNIIQHILSVVHFENHLNVEYYDFDSIDIDLLVNSTKGHNQDINVIFRNDEICRYFSYFDNMAIEKAVKNGWRKICYDSEGYIFYHGNSDGEIIVIPSNKKFVIFGFIAALVLLMVLTFHCIAFYRYKRDNRINSSNELCDYSEEEDL